MTTTNDVTGDKIISKPNSKEFDSNWERIFGEKPDDSDKHERDKSVGADE